MYSIYMFIVDNDDENWKALHYLNEWCEISNQFINKNITEYFRCI